MVFFVKSLCANLKKNSNSGWKKKVAVYIQKLLLGGRKKLIKSTCFYLKISQVHVFCSNFSRACMFYDDNHYKLVP